MDDNEKELEFLRQVFRKFDTDDTGYLEDEQFVRLIRALTHHVPEIESVDSSIAKAAFAYYDVSGDGKLSFQEVYAWWISDDRFVFFVGDKARLLKRARQLYVTYAKGEGGMSFTEFEALLDDMQIQHDESAFDEIDDDGDGLMSFTEFIDWLDWF